MKAKPKQTPPTSVSRRTGLDRRWIASPDHQPERRSGVDRRHSRPQTLDTVLETESAEPSRQSSPGSDSAIDRSTSTSADASPGEPRVLRLPALRPKPATDDGR